MMRPSCLLAESWKGLAIAKRSLVASHGPLAAARAFASESGFGEDLERRRVWRWGATEKKNLRMEATVEVSKNPTLLEDFRGVTAAACATSHSGIVVDGTLYTFGSNKWAQLGRQTEGKADEGVGADPDEVVVEASDGYRPQVQKVALGAFHSAAITEGGALWTWGWGGSFWYGAGALGQGSRQSLEEPTLVERFVEMGEEICDVACGSQHTLVLTSEGRLFSTGKGDFGRLGRGDTRDELEFEEIEYFSQSNDSVLNPDESAVITKVGAGDNFSAALSKQGELWVWGRNEHGQLGLGEEAMGDMYSAERYPRLVRALPLEGHRIIDFDCGEHHVVVLTSSGAIYEWGNRTWLEPHPVTLPSRYEDGLKGIIKVAAGEKCNFALTEEGRVYSWGMKSSGCLVQGDGAPKTVVEPTPVPPEMFSHQRVVDIVVSKNRCLAITLEDSHVA